MKLTEKIGDQWYQTTIEVNGSMKDIPLLGRIFGTKQVTCDQKWDEENIVELHSVIYRGKIYIYKEIITTRTKINGLKDNTYNQEFYWFQLEGHSLCRTYLRAPLLQKFFHV